MKILISGSTGTLGYGLAKYLSLFTKYQIIRHGFSKSCDLKIDFTDKKEIIFSLENINPDIIINLVCLSDVDECERDLDNALLYNSTILKHLSLWSKNSNCKIIHISTDQVYDSINKYNNEDEVNLKNNYSLSKYKGEQILNNRNACILRTNFFGYSQTKKTLNEWFLNSIANKKEIQLFEDIYFNPVLMDTLYKCINYVINNFKSGVFNFGSKEGFSKADFCMNLMKKLNINYKYIKRVSVEDSNLIAYRPRGMMMSTEKFSRNFNFKIPDINDEINMYIEKYKPKYEN